MTSRRAQAKAETVDSVGREGGGGGEGSGARGAAVAKGHSGRRRSLSPSLSSLRSLLPHLPPPPPPPLDQHGRPRRCPRTSLPQSLSPSLPPREPGSTDIDIIRIRPDSSRRPWCRSCSSLTVLFVLAGWRHHRQEPRCSLQAREGQPREPRRPPPPRVTPGTSSLAREQLLTRSSCPCSTPSP